VALLFTVAAASKPVQQHLHGGADLGVTRGRRGNRQPQQPRRARPRVQQNPRLRARESRLVSRAVVPLHSPQRATWRDPSGVRPHQVLKAALPRRKLPQRKSAGGSCRRRHDGFREPGGQLSAGVSQIVAAVLAPTESNLRLQASW